MMAESVQQCQSLAGMARILAVLERMVVRSLAPHSSSQEMVGGSSLATLVLAVMSTTVGG